MNRADGYRLRNCDPFYEVIPHIMPRRYDAVNYIDLELDLEAMHAYINRCRNRGIKMDHMSVIIAAYLRLVSQNPNLNRFVCNKRIYARNHFCVSFTTLKAKNTEETVTKIYFNLDDDIFEVNRKVSEAIETSRNAGVNNSMDRLLRNVMKTPFLVRCVVNTLKWWDRHFSLPFRIIDGSPFHTSLFLTNLASIRLKAVYHHIYDFGTTGLFIAIGQPEKRLAKVGEVVKEKRVLPLKVSADDRVESGYYYARCFREFKRYATHPEELEKKPETIVRDAGVKVRNQKFIVK